MKNKLLLLGLIGVSILFFFILTKKNNSDTDVTVVNNNILNSKVLNSFSEDTISHSSADEPDKFAEYFRNITIGIGEKKSGYKMNYKIAELNKAVEQSKSLKLNKIELPWVQRGPANIGGRTRAIIVDPDDASHNTWIVGAATGGLWKTIDAGNTWTDLSGNFSNLSVCALKMADSNKDVIYAGTGESFTGDGFKGTGIWKSVDRGITWTQLTSTATDENFAYINRLIINPTDENIVLAATQTGIFKSIDGGTSWSQVYSSNRPVEDLTSDPTNFNILFAGENSVGVIRSSDSGDSWSVSSDGIGGGKRFEVTVSKVDHNYVFTAVEISTDESCVYFSNDNGIKWKKFDDPQDFLGGQGWYDNVVTAHPYNADEVFVGGVDIWKLKFNGSESTSAPEVLTAYTENTSFLSFINFGGTFLEGGLSIEEGTNLFPSDWTSIEIRFGPGLSQKAHRFTVPTGATSGVLASDYTYQDYVDVPFQVWDTESNTQLMVSFRDQENDGEFNLYKRTGDNYGELGREYVFVNSVPYSSTTPDFNIALAGGHLYKNLYMFWPTLKEGETWNSSNLPLSEIVVKYGSITSISGEKTSIADSYGNYGGPNGYDQNSGYGTISIPGLHPDHHNITIIPTGDPNFIMIDGNDGGIGISYDNGTTLDEIPNNYITTQYYGVAKHPSKNEYIGGMQDNGTWQSPLWVNASSTSNYYFRLGGDGFECLWNANDENLLLGSLYYNKIYQSTNRGESWSRVSGISYNDGPFITKISGSKEDPNTVFAVGNTGVYKSTNFGETWVMKTISPNWAKDNSVSSSHNVEVSLANGKIVWAGGGMATDYGLQMHVSTDYGNSFTTIADYTVVSMDAYISGIATHPTNPNTAYVLFSLAHAPKILRTTDLGQTWTDISGFGTGTESINGFPDVVTHCLLVMPNDTNVIWAGTNIGLFESIDNGISWHIADNGLPPVSVYDMQIVGHQIVLATHGRGIWTVDIPEIDNVPYITSFKRGNVDTLVVDSEFKVNYDSVQVYINNTKDTVLFSPSTGVQNIDVDTTLIEDSEYSAYIIGYIGLNPYFSNTINYYYSTVSVFSLPEFIESLKVYPNPSSGILYFDIDNSVNKMRLSVYNINGQQVYSENKVNNGKNSLNLSFLSNGTYFMEVNADNKRFSQTIQINK